MIGDITSDGYNFSHVARARQRGGVVGSLFKRTLSVKIAPVKTKSCECLNVCITFNGNIFRMKAVCMLHTKHEKNGINNNLFFTEFGALISMHILQSVKLLFV